MSDPQWTHTWSWSKRPIDRDRKGMRCVCLAVGKLGSAQVLFEDGVTHITSRRGLRKIKPTERRASAPSAHAPESE